MKTISFNDWNSTLRPSVESLYQRLPIISVPATTRNDQIQELEYNLNLAQTIVSELRSLIELHEFKSEKEEIQFFKNIKPLFSSSLIYWGNILNLHLHKPIGGESILRKYYKRKLKKLKIFFESHSSLYEYLRANYDYLDSLYFLRSSRKFDDSADSIDLNPQFTTVKDRLVSEIYANDLLEHYIHDLISPAPKTSHNTENEIQNLKWTGSRAGLVELIYALQSGGVYNNGLSGIKEIADTFQKLFQFDLGNYYHVFNEIRLRKKSRTSLLDHLREKVIEKMDNLDEK